MRKKGIIIGVLLLFGVFQAFPVATLNSVSFYRHKAVSQSYWGGYPPVQTFSSTLTVQFRVYNSGPGHTAYLRYTTNNWATYGVQNAVFQYHATGGYEVWQATVVVSTAGVTFDYVIGADDHAAVNDVLTRWYNNNGNGCRILATSSTAWSYSPRP